MCFNIVFSLFSFEKYTVHLAFTYKKETRKCVPLTFVAANLGIQALNRHAVGLCTFYIGRGTREKKNVSPHFRLAYMFNIDLISHLIWNTLIIYLFEKAIYFHHNAYIKTSDWIESQACGLVFSWCRNDIPLPHFSSSITMSNILHTLPKESARLIRVSFTIKNTVVKTASVHARVMSILYTRCDLLLQFAVIYLLGNNSCVVIYCMYDY